VNSSPLFLLQHSCQPARNRRRNVANATGLWLWLVAWPSNTACKPAPTYASANRFTQTLHLQHARLKRTEQPCEGKCAGRDSTQARLHMRADTLGPHSRRRVTQQL
jgi:hypothetical protein